MSFKKIAYYLLMRNVRIQIKDPNSRTTEPNLKDLRDDFGKKQSEKLATEVEQKKLLRHMLA